ncbi:Vps53-like protein [Tricharina praecox]|uniref:Vps53-like protein n=1 Tax=Tricharina praecox TaxID=43433 RepID=UPI00221F1E8B|nr:Vps53-like protein [Tricharina praecox]KAI5858605.1 Vps53-like protein [Tricharina praecox]
MNFLHHQSAEWDPPVVSPSSPGIRSPLTASVRPSDPLDAPDYDPIDHLNALFSHPSTLGSVTPVAQSLDSHLDALDDEITDLVITQSATNADSLARISAAKADLSELFKNIDTVRTRAMRTEEAITAMTADIKKLDSTKRNLTLSMTMLKRLQMLTTAFEQLKANTKMRQYRESASLLSAVLELMTHFKSYRSITQIATLSRNVADLRAELLEQVCEDFELAFVKDEVASRKGMLSEACNVVDALGDTARQRIVNWYCNTQLREYRQVFRGNDEAGSLDNISRRYAWFKRMLKVYDEEHAGIFPPSWKVNEVLANSYCDGTKDDYKGILQRAMRKESGKSLDVNLLLSALQETLDFELYLERRFGADPRMSMETMSPKDDRERSPTTFSKTISEAFEPYLSLWVEAQEKTLSQMIPQYRSQPLRPPNSPEEDFNPASSVLPSSIELFHFYRQTLAQCAKLSTGAKLLELSRIYGRCLDEYADTVLASYLNTSERLPVEEIAVILNTADYCHTTTAQLEERIRSRIDKPLDERIDFERQSDNFMGVVSKVIFTLVRRVEVALEPGWREMRNCPWARMESVGDQSGYVGVLLEKLKVSAQEVIDVIGKDVWRRSFCDRVVETVVAGFLASIVACRPIGGVGAEQMLLDAYVIKKALEEVITLRKPAAHPGHEEASAQPPQSYLKHVTRTLAKLDGLLKTLQVSTSPSEGIVQAYLIHIADSNPGNFKKVLDLKGVRKVEQAAFVELFKVHVPAHDGLVENSPVMAGLNLGTVSSVGQGMVGGSGQSSAPGGSKGGFENLSAVLAAARDGVDTLRKEGDIKDGGLGKLFRRDGSGGFRFGREREGG